MIWVWLLPSPWSKAPAHGSNALFFRVLVRIQCPINTSAYSLLLSLSSTYCVLGQCLGHKTIVTWMWYKGHRLDCINPIDYHCDIVVIVDLKVCMSMVHIVRLLSNYFTLVKYIFTEIQVVPPWVGCPTLGKMSPNVPLWRVQCPTKSHLKKYFWPYFFRTVPNINIKETIILAGFVRILFLKNV